MVRLHIQLQLPAQAAVPILSSQEPSLDHLQMEVLAIHDPVAVAHLVDYVYVHLALADSTARIHRRHQREQHSSVPFAMPTRSPHTRPDYLSAERKNQSTETEDGLY